MTREPEQEIEVKFPNVDLEVTRETLRAIGAQLLAPMRLMRRTVYGHEANSQLDCTYGRVRDEGNVVTMSAKYSAVNGEITSQKEAMVTVDSFENAVTLLHAFGLVATDYQENKRETWQLHDTTLVELEQWPDLPSYIEIEGPSVDALQSAATKLGLNWDNHTTDSTDKLYAQHLALPIEEVWAKLKDLRF